uniref:Uncharacterized protein n=1 Tax=Rhizophora mucronata TaxID=61149 RepID=A0A2P2KN84_RHIMU
MDENGFHHNDAYLAQNLQHLCRDCNCPYGGLLHHIHLCHHHCHTCSQFKRLNLNNTSLEQDTAKKTEAFNHKVKSLSSIFLFTQIFEDMSDCMPFTDQNPQLELINKYFL